MVEFWVGPLRALHATSSYEIQNRFMIRAVLIYELGPVTRRPLRLRHSFGADFLRSHRSLRTVAKNVFHVRVALCSKSNLFGHEEIERREAEKRQAPAAK
jgi:hypothetical protein